MSFTYRPSSASNRLWRPSRASWGPNSAPPEIFPVGEVGGLSSKIPCGSEEELAELLQDKITLYGNDKQDFPLQEDLADWINKTLNVGYITGEKLYDFLDNGVALHRLANAIYESAKDSPEFVSRPLRKIRGRCWDNAARRSFFARDNMENFIRFCRSIGVHENMLFESDDLVLQVKPRNVLVCLLELARLATRYNVEPPGLVQLEKEIAEEEVGTTEDTNFICWQFQPESDLPKIRTTSSATEICHINHWAGEYKEDILVETPTTPKKAVFSGKNVKLSQSGASDGVPSDNTEDEWSRGSPEDPDLDIDTSITVPITRNQELTELDRRVQRVTRLMQKTCDCSDGKCDKRLHVQKLGEGRYSIAGRNYFIRLLKGRHMMVRVGGGWETFEHFIKKFNACEVRLDVRQTIMSSIISTSNIKSPHAQKSSPIVRYEKPNSARYLSPESNTNAKPTPRPNNLTPINRTRRTQRPTRPNSAPLPSPGRFMKSPLSPSDPKKSFSAKLKNNAE